MKTILRALSTALSMLILLSSVSVFSVAESGIENLKAQSSELIDSSVKFTDVNASSWYKNYVDYVATHELMNGMTPDTFGPNLSLTRAMFVQILANFSGVNTENRNVSTPFTDVPSGKWYSAAVSWASENYIVNGTSPIEFSPEDNIQRQQMCVMLIRFADQKGIEIKKVTESKSFKDDNRIQAYAKEAVDICKAAGIVDGMSEDSFAPRDSATRAQIAAIIFRFCQNTGFLGAAGIPDESETPDDSIEPEYPDVEFDKYNFDENPLVNNDLSNYSVLPSFDIDKTGFIRKGTKLSDLDGKTLMFYTGDNNPAWSYRGEHGESIDEWIWFEQLRTVLGLNIKYTIKQHQAAIDASLQDMNAGKQCDIIYTNHVAYPSSLCISRSLDNLINMNRLGASPGVCSNAIELAKWGKGNRVIAPIGNVDVLWYNQLLTQELGLSDPHKLWEEGRWNWQSFSDYLNSVPENNNNGERLVAFAQWYKNASYIWPSTNGIQNICIDNKAERPTIINNWEEAETYEAWEFITGVCNNINYSVNSYDYQGLYNGTTLMTATMYNQTYRDCGNYNRVQINWVPYPKSMNEQGRDICQWRGYAMMLPKRTVNPENVYAALKFMELWATRFTESIFDGLYISECYNFNYKQRKQYFDFVTNNMVFALPMNDFIDTNIRDDTKFFECFMGNAEFNVREEADKAAAMMQDYILQCMKYGQ